MKLVVNFNEKTGEMDIDVSEHENLRKENKLAAFIVILTELMENGFEKILKDEKVSKGHLDRLYVALEIESKRLVSKRHLSEKEKENVYSTFDKLLGIKKNKLELFKFKELRYNPEKRWVTLYDKDENVVGYVNPDWVKDRKETE